MAWKPFGSSSVSERAAGIWRARAVAGSETGTVAHLSPKIARDRISRFPSKLFCKPPMTSNSTCSLARSRIRPLEPSVPTAQRRHQSHPAVRIRPPRPPRSHRTPRARPRGPPRPVWRNSPAALPRESEFSCAFALFAHSRLPQQFHAALLAGHGRRGMKRPSSLTKARPPKHTPSSPGPISGATRNAR